MLEGMIFLTRQKEFRSNVLEELFESVEWDSARDRDRLQKGIENSSTVVCAFELTPSPSPDKLVGLIRSMDDGCWCANIDCLLVRKEYQRQGIGTELVKEMLRALKDVKYINVCPNSKDTIDFYKKFGFQEINSSFLQKIQ